MESYIQKPFSLSARDMKWIALLTMLIDHIGAAMIEVGIFQYDTTLIDTLPNGNLWLGCDILLRMIGRLSFPLFAFLLVEGYLHTHNKKRYLLQLCFLAVVSEIPYDLAFQEVQYQNIFFTLSISFCVMWIWDIVQHNHVLQVLSLVGGCLLAYLLQSDYGALGVLMILFFYMFHENHKWRNICVGAILLYQTLPMLGVGLLTLYILHFYNGKAGNTRYKYFFYAFYPLHLCVLALLRYLFFTN